MIYLDNNATTQPARAVIDAITRGMIEVWGNPSSVHASGQAARHAVEEAREEVASLIGCTPREVIFTSGGTESCNLALRGSLGGREGRSVIVTTHLEHTAIRDCARVCAANEGGAQRWRGHCEVEWLATDKGLVDMGALERVLESRSREVAVVSVMWANNETGIVQPIAEIASLCRRHGVRFHSDATQWVGKMPTQLGGLDVDLLTLSAHKFHGPKGVGALYCRRGTSLDAQILGGHQERDRRGGTENVPGIIGLGIAARLAAEWLKREPHERVRLGSLRDHFERTVCGAIERAQVIGAREPRLWNTSTIAFGRLQAEAMLVALSAAGLCASAGAACSSGSLDPSPVLIAMGVHPELAHGAIRFSLSRNTTERELVDAARIVIDMVNTVAKSMPASDLPTGH